MTDVEIYEPPAGQLEEYQARMVMAPADAKALDDQLRACTKAVLREGTDFGTIPGTNGGQVLLKPGAEKLLQWFGFAYRMDCLDIERDDGGVKQGATYRCTVVKRIGHPERGLAVEVATCEGYAGYDEDKFYQSAEQAQFKAEAKERMWAAKDGRVANPNKWKHLTGYRAPWNTIIKMAQKRALVGAAIDATAAAGLFGQEEDEGPVADDGSTWYEQALEAALTFTTEEAGRKLYVDAAQAARDGLCTPSQANRIQNRIEQRVKLLGKAKPADVEDLGRQAQEAADPGPEPSGQPAGHEPAPGPGSAPGDDHHRKLVGAVQGHFKRLGFADDDRAERLWAAGKLAGVKDLGSLNDLDPGELAAVAGALAQCKTRKALEAVLGQIQPEGGTGE